MRYALVFDFGGVIMKTATREPRWAWDDRLGLTRGDVERAVHNDDTWRLAQSGLLPLPEYWADVAQRLGVSEGDIARLEEDFYSGDRLDASVIDLIKRQKAAGQRIALLSNDSPALIEKLRRLKIASLFDPLIVSAHIGVMKPEPAAYHAVLDEMDWNAGDAVFIDDMITNVQGARDVGMIGVLYKPDLDLAAALAPYLR